METPASRGRLLPGMDGMPVNVLCEGTAGGVRLTYQVQRLTHAARVVCASRCVRVYANMLLFHARAVPKFGNQ